ncbi:MAG TPA: hypothetical protein VNM92_12550, partial [Thermoanaerobaculia bacterium]|nr:hypothetical protein [Thermoanaerobaculia bacterium]
GYACSWMMSILNRKRYAAQWLYREAQLIDEWPDTPPGEGTSVRAAFDILRTIGHRPMWGPVMRPQFLSAGIESNRWARTVDELRTTIAQGVPGVLGINWYASFDTPEKHNGEWWIGRGPLGRMRGGHGIAYCAASDRREALQLPNSWGERYPDVWIPYDVVQRLINEDGEAGVIVDRPDA